MRCKSYTASIGVLIVLFVFSSLSEPLSAAQAPPPDTVPTPLRPVVVRVMRVPVESQKVPFAISVLGERALRTGKAGISVQEALQGLPGVQIQNRYNYAVGERVSIRGFGARSQFGVRGIRIFVDGIPATVADGQSTLDHLDIGSLGRVEILRGPAASLYGNAAGGVLDFRTRMAPPSGRRHEVLGVIGSDGLIRAQTTSSGSVGSAAYLLNVARLDFDGFRTNLDDPDGDAYGSTHRWTVNGTVVSPLGNGELRLVFNGVELNAENPGSLSQELFDAGERQAFGFNVARRTGKEVSQGQLGATWEGGAPWGRLEATSYGIFRSIVNPIPTRIIDLDRWASGGRILTGSDGSENGVRWMAGTEFDVQSDDRLNFVNDGGSRGDLSLDQDERVRGLGGFAQIEVPLGDRLRAMGSLRYDHFRFEVDDRFIGTDNPDDSGERSMDQWSPSLGLVLAASEEVDLYTSVARSFETPTTTELANRPTGSGGFNPALEPQDGLTYETGVRARLRRVALEASLYWTEFDNQLVPFEVPNEPSRAFFRNAGASTYKGGEALLWVDLGGGFTGQATYSYTNARFDSFITDGDDFSGSRVPGVAPNRLEGLLSYAPENWLLELRSEYLDQVPVTDDNSARADDYWVFDLRATLDGVSTGGFELSPFGGVNNLFDTDYVSSVVVNAFGSRYFEPGPGRSFYFGLSAGWGQ